MTLNIYKKEIAELDSRILKMALKDVSNWDIQGFLVDESKTPAKRKQDAIDDLKAQRTRLLANAGELALYGYTDNLGIG